MCNSGLFASFSVSVPGIINVIWMLQYFHFSMYTTCSLYTPTHMNKYCQNVIIIIIIVYVEDSYC